MPDSSLRWCSKCLESTRSLFSLYCPRRVGADGNSAEGRCAVDCLLSVRERTDASWSWHHSKMFCAALPVSHSKPSRYSKPVGRRPDISIPPGFNGFHWSTIRLDEPHVRVREYRFAPEAETEITASDVFEWRTRFAKLHGVVQANRHVSCLSGVVTLQPVIKEAFTFHDLRAKSGSDAEDVQEAE
jgi:hypothetical protein